MKIGIRLILLTILLFCSLLLPFPALGHEDLEEGSGSEAAALNEGDGHSEEADDHDAKEDGTLSLVLGGIIGAAVLALGGVFLFNPRPNPMTLIGLALIGMTGVIHLMIGVGWGNILLVLNGLGYLILGIMWALPVQSVSYQKRLFNIVLIVYTLITIAGYFLTHDHYDFIAILTKVVEVLLLIALAFSLFLVGEAD